MDSSIEATAAAMEALSEQYRSIAHNLANVSTAGYKRRITEFAEALRQASGLVEPGQSGEVPRVVGQMLIDYTQGGLEQTGRSLDLALQGKGFFVVETENGPLYTRSGVFRLNAQNQLVDLSGRLVAGQAGPIVVPPDASVAGIEVSLSGNVRADGKDIGQLKIVEFEDPSVLEPVGGSCFQAPEQVAPAPAQNTEVYQGFKESSNVNVVEELVGLIGVTRLYEANIKSIKTQDERMKYLLEVAMG